MSAEEKRYFLENVTFFYDTREKENWEVLRAFEHCGVKFEPATMSTGDYSFYICGRDYRHEWVAERKGSLGEIYQNIMEHDSNGKRNRLEREFERMGSAKERLLFLQGVNNINEVRAWKNPKATFQGDRAGEHIYATLMSWECANRYNFKIICQRVQFEIGMEMVIRAYYYWRNDMKSLFGDNFLKSLKNDKKVCEKVLTTSADSSIL